MTQVYSQNGWPAFHTAEAGEFVRFEAGGRGWWAANADVAVVAGEYIERFNDRVEPVVYPHETYDDWSFADRLVRGSTATVSNHGSATAWDINSTRHLLGADNTFSDADEARLRAIVADLTDDAGRPVLRWGGSYSGRLDEMHVEVIGTAAQLHQAANKIRARKEDDMPTPEALWGADVIPVSETATAKTNKTWSPQNALGRVVDRSEQIYALLVKATAQDAARDAAHAAALKALAGAGITPAELAKVTEAAQAGATAALAAFGPPPAGG